MRLPRRIAPLVFLLLLRPVTAADSSDDVEKLARELVHLRVESARAESAWRTERELLTSMTAALQEKAAASEEKAEQVKAATAREREELETVRTRTQGARDAVKVLESRLAVLTARLVTLRPSLPPRLSEALEMSYRSLADTSQPPSERLRLAMNVLNRCAQFNRLVTTGEDVITPEGAATARSLEVVYWGLSRGYALDRARHQAWLGAPEAGAWRWAAKPEAFDRVAELFAIASDQADPELVLVPAPGPKALTPPRAVDGPAKTP